MELNPYRGNVFQTKKLDPETGAPVTKDSLGALIYELMDTTSTALRDNYKRPVVFNYLDGDKESNAFYPESMQAMREAGPDASRDHAFTLVSDKARVIKGGSWADRAFWLSPGARRFLEEDKASRTVGFRCAMTRTGNPIGNDEEGNEFKTKKKKAKRKY